MLVVVVAMQIPVAGLIMNLDIAHPQCAIDFHLRIEEVWPTIAIVQSWVYDLYLLTVSSVQPSYGPHFVFPAVVK